jgi:hypothetical protein
MDSLTKKTKRRKMNPDCNQIMKNISNDNTESQKQEEVKAIKLKKSAKQIAS